MHKPFRVFLAEHWRCDKRKQEDDLNVCSRARCQDLIGFVVTSETAIIRSDIGIARKTTPAPTIYRPASFKQSARTLLSIGLIAELNNKKKKRKKR